MGEAGWSKSQNGILANAYQRLRGSRMKSEQKWEHREDTMKKKNF